MSENDSPRDPWDRYLDYEDLSSEQMEPILKHIDREDAKTEYHVLSALINNGLRVDTLHRMDIADFLSASNRSDTSEDSEDGGPEDSEAGDSED